MREKAEKRNVYLNLAWTSPVDNTPLQANISYDKVANAAVDMFCDASEATKAVSAERQSATKAASTEAGEEGASRPQPRRSVFEVILDRGKLPWRIPTCVERGFEIPFCVTNAYAVPELGKFTRLGMDVVVNAVWLAYYWAKKEKNREVGAALQSLILDWPMDFVLIQGSTPEEIEENKFLWGVNLSANVERLRDFIGLESSNLMRIVAQAADFMKAKLTSTKKANVQVIQEWLATNVNWGALRCPDTPTVERHLLNWGHIQIMRRCWNPLKQRCSAGGAITFWIGPRRLA